MSFLLNKLKKILINFQNETVTAPDENSFIYLFIQSKRFYKISLTAR